jgi:DNA-binding response OmpR family regulator
MDAPLVAVIDHEATLLLQMEELLTAEGYRVLPIADATKAYETIKRNQPQLIVLDTWLDEHYAGVGLIRLLKLDERTSAVPVVVVSSDEREELEKRLGSGTTNDGVPLLFKPLEPEQLLEVVRSKLPRDEA